MNGVDAKRLLHESLERPSNTPNTSNQPRQKFLDQELRALRECLIEPELVRAVASEWAVKNAGQTPEEQSFWAVARSGTTWLLLHPETREFFKADSLTTETHALVLVGFSSDDALAEWLG